MGNKLQRRALQFGDLQESVDEVRRLDEAGYSQAGNWDLAKACRHLTKTVRMSMEGAPFQLPFFLRPIARWILFNKVMTGKPTRLPLRTAPQFQPEDGLDVREQIDAYASVVAEVLEEEAPLLERHPVFGHVSKAEWRTFHAWHAAHHLSYLIPAANSATSSNSAALAAGR